MTAHSPIVRPVRVLPLLAMLLGFAAPLLVATEAMALTKTRFNATRAPVAAACKSAGGTETGYGTSSYGCDANCGRLGQQCQVDCKDGQGCTGTTPRTDDDITTLTQLLGQGVTFDDRLARPSAVPQSLSERSDPGTPQTQTGPMGPPPIL